MAFLQSKYKLKLERFLVCMCSNDSTSPWEPMVENQWSRTNGRHFLAFTYCKFKNFRENFFLQTAIKDIFATLKFCN